MKDIVTSLFGTTKSGEKVFKYTMENDNGMRVSVSFFFHYEPDDTVIGLPNTALKAIAKLIILLWPLIYIIMQLKRVVFT